LPKTFAVADHMAEGNVQSTYLRGKMERTQAEEMIRGIVKLRGKPLKSVTA